MRLGQCLGPGWSAARGARLGWCFWARVPAVRGLTWGSWPPPVPLHSLRCCSCLTCSRDCSGQNALAPSSPGLRTHPAKLHSTTNTSTVLTTHLPSAQAGVSLTQHHVWEVRGSLCTRTGESSKVVLKPTCSSKLISSHSPQEAFGFEKQKLNIPANFSLVSSLVFSRDKHH